MILNKSPLGAENHRLFRTEATRPLTLLRQCPAYQPTPFAAQGDLAATLGVASLMVKDESKRMRLGSFKALGGAFAVAQMIIDVAGVSDLENPVAKTTAKGMTFITASAGNHGLSVAAGARLFGAQAIVYLSSAVPEEFAERIRSLDARVVRVDGSYELSVREATAAADKNHWLHLADGSWDGYVERPALVMEGYTVLAEECREIYLAKGVWPTHVFLQAGVGGLAAAVAGHIREYWDQQPEIIVVEPDAAPCLRESISANAMTKVTGPLSNMGRLDCKDASLIAFQSLKQDADGFITISDTQAADAVVLLAAHGIQTTPSGGASVAALGKVNPGAESRCMVIITEGPEEG